ncbi:hypothetical protein SLEP1_g25672 [Rubroshorea leprosula]|uniref:DUF4220 domain-containing protein n=1 Tax=Rubroshorea leprosula TaxID=152421 RepID=A0AAV5JVZ7_9ROSI|nr:hypothetical protein SLEP1_g25672 [Rubroshorea leprosula]
MKEVFPPPLRKFWKEWELRGAALFSLTLQIILILSGNRRKYKCRTRYRVIVWFAYMLADSVATIALGILSNDLGQVNENGGNIEVGNELKAFWAPFFLLHLGGPDTITAYSLEDNELYLRHLFGLIVQTTAAVYILILAWTSSRLSYLSIVVIVVGSIKYGERTWALWKSSRNKLRDTILTDPDPGPNYPKFMEEYTLRDAEGFSVDIIEMKEGQANLDVTVPRKTAEKDVPAENEHNLVKAHALFQTFKSLFADLILSYHDRDSSQGLFKEMSDENAFNVIEIELGFMYDLVYTKAPVIYTRWGFVRRFLTFFLTCGVFTSFILDDKFRHNRTDFWVTVLLLVVAIFLEIYAALIVLASDQTRVWLIKHGMTSIRSLEELFKWFKVQRWSKRIEQCLKVPRWSKTVAQYSLLWPSLKEKLSHKIIEEYRYKEINKFSADYRKLIFDHVRKKFVQFEEQRKEQQGRSTSSLETALREVCGQRGKGVLDEYKEKIGQVDLEWSISVEFDQSILIWHMATEICYYSPEDLSDEVKLSRDFSLHMSRYMLYLLVIYPFMLPVGIGLIRFRDTRAEAMEFFKEQLPTTTDGGTYCAAALAELRRKICSSVVGVEKRRKKACKSLLEVRTDIPPIKVKGDRSKSVLFDACMLASRLKTISDPNVKWDLMRDMWLELLAYAACHCKGSQHGQQLRRGGELLTHVWLLMAHFGLTEQFQISQGHARARLVTK